MASASFKALAVSAGNEACLEKTSVRTSKRHLQHGSRTARSYPPSAGLQDVLKTSPSSHNPLTLDPPFPFATGRDLRLRPPPGHHLKNSQGHTKQSLLRPWAGPTYTAGGVRRADTHSLDCRGVSGKADDLLGAPFRVPSS